MNVLFVRPRPETMQFGLAPFFQTEPLGLEYIGAELRRRGHRVDLVDMRFESRAVATILRDTRPDVVGIACLHIVDAPATRSLAAAIKAIDPERTVLIGGQAITAYPEALRGCSSFDAICLGEGEQVVPEVLDAVAAHRSLSSIPGLALPGPDGALVRTDGERRLLDLAEVLPPERSLVTRYQKEYCCVNYMPLWAMETARGCPFSCTFCSIWQFYHRKRRYHTHEHVRADWEASGANVFMVDDLFWGDPGRSSDLAKDLLHSPERKRWILVQARPDTVAGNPELLALWRALSGSIDIFFGFEAASTGGLEALNKRSTVETLSEAVKTARSMRYGITGNFIVDPDFTEEDFRALWAFMEANAISRAGFTILTPLPGTTFFDQIKDRIAVFDWNQYDMHHLLWRPRLPIARFFELYAETWRRSMLSVSGTKSWVHWAKKLELTRAVRLFRLLRRTQKMMDARTYLEHTSALLAESRPPAAEPGAR